MILLLLLLGEYFGDGSLGMENGVGGGMGGGSEGGLWRSGVVAAG